MYLTSTSREREKYYGKLVIFRKVECKKGGVRREVNGGWSTALLEQQRQERRHKVHCISALEMRIAVSKSWVGESTCVGNANEHELAAFAER